MNLDGIELALLDVDGTLLDSNDAHARAWVKALKLNRHEIAYDRVRPLIGKGGDKLLPELLGISDDAAEGKRIAQEAETIFGRDHLPHLEPTSGARELLLFLRGHGLKLFVATSSAQGPLHSLLQQAGVADLIDAMISADDVDRSKPDPDVIHAALSKAAVPAQRAIMVGDTPYDMQAARLAGVRGIALRSGGWWPDAAFAEAVAIYDDPGALLVALGGAPSAGCGPSA